MRHLRRLLVAASVVLLGLAGAVTCTLRASLPARSGEIRVRGVGSAVEIRFDARARPYVDAASMEDALFAEGFLHARERLWQMELFRRAGLGRLSEALGPDMLDADRELWRSGVPQLAAALEARAGEETRRAVAAYVDGVNAGLDSLPALPPELWLTWLDVRPWRVSDVYALGALMAFQSARNADNELLRWALAQTLEPDEMAAFLPDEAALPDFPYTVGRRAALATLARRDALDAARRALLPSVSFGSNGWAVAPERSRNGYALFAFDSHDALGLPNLLYEVHLFFGRGQQIRGWSVAGLPGVVNGFNEGMAWGFTNIGDSQDLFLEERHPTDPGLFRAGDGWERARVEEVRIPVRGRDEPERLRILHTRNGPLLQDDPPISLAWSAHHLGDLGLDALFALNRATDAAMLDAALDRFAAPSANLTYADVDGRIVFRTVGLLPKRGRGDGLLPQSGADPDAGWQGMWPLDALPHELDPDRGFVAAANARVSPPGSGPLVSADNAPGYRIARIQSVLGEPGPHDVAGMQALQMDWTNPQAVRLLPALWPAIADAPLEEPAATARSVLDTWRRRPVDDPASAGAVVFEGWYLDLARRVFAERLGPELWARVVRRNYVLNHALDGLLLAAPDSPWWRAGREATIREAFEASVAASADTLGDDPTTWRWDARHSVRFDHELGSAVAPLRDWLGRGPFRWGGSAATVGRAADNYDRPGVVRRGATVRVVAEMSRPMRTFAVIPGGQSGHPLDRHYDDQIEAWLAGELEPLASTFEEARGTRLVLSPAP